MIAAKKYFILFLKGLSIGIADLIPGVSGGTVAFMLGIYGSLMQSLTQIDKKMFSLLWKKEYRLCWQHIQGNFLLAVFVGLLIGIFFFSPFILWVLTHFSFVLFGFLFGLILTSGIFFFQDISKKTWQHYSSCFFSCATTYLLMEMGILATPHTYIWWLIAGMLAIVAMVLPGISGSMVLLLLDKYTLLLQALQNFQWDVLLFFSLGCVLGLLFFARWIQWLLLYHQKMLMSVLVGCMLGALYKVWPWQATLTGINYHLLPWHFTHMTGHPSRIFLVLFCMFFGGFFFIYMQKNIPKSIKDSS